jgi:HTH-type transcriptional regulator/antitoxin HipB
MFVKSALDIGKVVGNARARMKLTQSQLARAVGASQNWVSEVEAGKPTAQIGKVLRVLNYLGVQLQIAGPAREAPPAGRGSGAEISLNDIIEAHSGPGGKQRKVKP